MKSLLKYSFLFQLHFWMRLDCLHILQPKPSLYTTKIECRSSYEESRCLLLSQTLKKFENMQTNAFCHYIFLCLKKYFESKNTFYIPSIWFRDAFEMVPRCLRDGFEMLLGHFVWKWDDNTDKAQKRLHKLWSLFCYVLCLIIS